MAIAPRRPNRRAIIVATIVVILIAVFASARFYTDLLWFDEVGLQNVLWKSLRTQFLVGIAVGAGVAAIIFVNLWIASRTEPAYRVRISGRPSPLEELEKYREALAPYLRWIRVGVALFLGLVTGIAASASWQTFLLWANRSEFGREDPQFGLDVGFYVFELPMYDRFLSWVWFALLAALVLSIAAHLLNGSLRPDDGLRGVQPGALAHVSVLLGSLALVKAAQYWLGQYELNFSNRGVVTGPSYTDVNAQLPALKLLAVISVISAILFLVTIWVRRAVLPLAAVGIWILTAVLAGGVWPAAIQYFSVRPQEVQRERPYIENNLEETTFAFDLTDVETRPFAASSSLEPGELESNQTLLQNVRLWDPPVLAQAYRQLQAIRPYYQFPDVDVDRYEIDGETRQVLLSARELSIEDLPENSKRWSNIHLQYTHGYGLVASLANEQTSIGQPSFLVKDVPGTAVAGAEALQPDQPRIYYGEIFEDDEYAIVNTDQAEIDYPTETGVERSSYEGEGGVRVGNLFNRIMFAIRESDPNLVLTNLIDSDSRILIYRDVRDRVLRAAPFLSFDHDPYPAVVDGRTVWIMDGYTSTEWYPNSQRFDFSSLVPDSVEGESIKGVLSGDKNYVRNSVKVVVDAYDGTMKFFVVDESDPLIRVWRDIFPEIFTDEEPSDELREHFRYPEDLFTIQSDVYLTYHMKDVDIFYGKEDEWAVAATPDRDVSGSASSTDGEQEGDPVSPSYLLVTLPGETEQEFVLTRPFTPSNRPNMIAMMAARSDADNYGEILTLQFPRSRQVPGPIQVDNLINQDVETSQTLTLLQQEGSDVRYGKQVILPIEDSLLYIQPLFVTAENGGIPELKKVAVVFGDEVVFEDNFDDALLELFGEPEPEPGPTPTPGPSPTPSPTPGGKSRVNEIVRKAAAVYERAQQALEDGNFELYGRLIERLGDLLAEAERLSND